MPKAKKEDASFPLGGNVQLSEAMAELVRQKIQEMENSRAAETEKTQKAIKGKARAAAKQKLKEAKDLLSSTIPNVEKKIKLWEQLQVEHKECDLIIAQCLERRAEIETSRRERDVCQSDLNCAVGVKERLESLCRQLKDQTNALVDERRRLSEMERQRRQELAESFQVTIDKVKTTMDEQAQERTRLAKENEDLRSRFKKFFEEYDIREKERVEQQHQRELKVHALEAKLSEHGQIYQIQARKEAELTRENDDLVATDKALREQLSTYSTKFNNFQESLSKSDKVLNQYKRQRNKMQRRKEVLEKENAEFRTRNERRTVQAQKDRDQAMKEKEKFQLRCKELQAERQRLLDEAQKLGGSEGP